MNITVFGASGGIGTHIVSLAAQRGHQVRAIYRATPQTPPPGQAEILVSPGHLRPRPRRPSHPRRRRGGHRRRPELHHPP